SCTWPALSQPVSPIEPTRLANRFGMEFLPVADRRAHGHETWIRMFVIFHPFVRRASLDQVSGFVGGEICDHLGFGSAFAQLVAEPFRPTFNSVRESIEMMFEVAASQSEVRKIKLLRAECTNACDRVQPRFDIQFGRDKWWHRWAPVKLNARDIAT